MTPRDFVFWLQGHMEINNPEIITAAQAEMIKDHLDITLAEMAKKKVNPSQVSQGGHSSASHAFGTTLYSNPLTNTLIC